MKDCFLSRNFVSSGNLWTYELLKFKEIQRKKNLTGSVLHLRNYKSPVQRKNQNGIQGVWKQREKGKRCPQLQNYTQPDNHKVYYTLLWSFN